MVDAQRDLKLLAITKVQEIVDQAVDANADSVTIEFAKEGGLEVYFVVGHTGVGGILVDRTLEGEVMGLIQERSGLEEKPAGVMHWESHGQIFDIRVKEYENFGEISYKLTFPGARH